MGRARREVYRNRPFEIEQVATRTLTVALSLFTDFTDGTDVAPNEHHQQALDRLLDQVIAWSEALRRGELVPVIVDPVALLSYAAFPPELDRDWLGRVCHLSAADLEVVRRRTDKTTRLGYAIQLVTVRAIGTFLPDPTAVPAPVIAAVARQLEVSDPAVLVGYRVLPVRWRHTAEIRDRCGYRDFTAQPGHFLLLVWLYRQAWSDELSPSVLFGAAHRRLLAEQILLPGRSVLARLVAGARERAARRLHTRLARVAPVELRARLEKLFLVPEGQRRSELDRLRRPPFTPTITGLVKALERLADVRALGVAELDLSHLPTRRVASLARYADQAWATQLADLGPDRRVATLLAYVHVLTVSARDDVIDIFDVVFGDLQRAATHRGQKRRAGELRDYDQAVGALHARLHAPAGSTPTSSFKTPFGVTCFRTSGGFVGCSADRRFKTPSA